MTWEDYGSDLEARLAGLHGRIHRGAYRARPSRRVWISKDDGRQRPLGIAVLEDKIVQYAVGRVLNQIWEEDLNEAARSARRTLRVPAEGDLILEPRMNANARESKTVDHTPPLHFGPAEVDQQGELET